MRKKVQELTKLGVLPSEDVATDDLLQAYKALLKSIKEPVSDEEARALVGLFGRTEDSCFGIAWSLLHLIETAPGWPLRDCLSNAGNAWVVRLQQRAGGLVQP